MYDMLCAADTVGVFQVESRAQMATLPRLRAAQLLRPGDRDRADPARPDPGRLGASLHPPPARPRAGDLPAPDAGAAARADARHPAVPGAADAAGRRRSPTSPRPRPTSCAGRWAPSARASGSRRMRIRLYDGMAANGITGEAADEIYEKIQAFAAFGFAESTLDLFALLVYASSWLKRHYPAAFFAALLNAQPMGFYSPQSLVHDAKRHGVEVRQPVAQLARRRGAPLEAGSTAVAVLRASTRRSRRCGSGCPRCARSAPSWPSGSWRRERPTDRTPRWPIWPAGSGCRPTRWRRWPLPGRSTGFGATRRDALVGGRRGGRRHVPVSSTCRVRRASTPPELPAMTEPEQLIADLWATGITPRCYPTALIRRPARRARGRHRGRAATHCRPHPGHRRRRGHPPAAAGHRPRGHLPQPRGRDRDGQRDLSMRWSGRGTGGSPASPAAC